MALKDIYIIREAADVIPFPKDRVKPTEKPFDKDASVTSMPLSNNRPELSSIKARLINSFNNFVGSDGMVDNFSLALVKKPYKVDADFQVKAGEYVLAAPLKDGKYTTGWADVWGGTGRMDSVPIDHLQYIE